MFAYVQHKHPGARKWGRGGGLKGNGDGRVFHVRRRRDS